MQRNDIIKILLVLVAFAGVASIAWHVLPKDIEVQDEPLTPTAPINLSVNDIAIDGIEGSYCTTELCVDKVGPTGFADTMFAPITSDNIVVTLQEPAREISISQRDGTGAPLKCDMQVTKVDATTYRATLCNDPGHDYYIDVGAWWDDGGDATYYFPIETP